MHQFTDQINKLALHMTMKNLIHRDIKCHLCIITTFILLQDLTHDLNQYDCVIYGMCINKITL